MIVICNFFSAIVKYTGDGEFELLHKLGTPEHSDAHSELARIFGLKKDADAQAKVEYVPQTDGTYKFELDEQREPRWWSDEIRTRVIDRLDADLSAWMKSGKSKTGELFTLTKNGKVEGNLNLSAFLAVDLTKLKSVGGSLYLQGTQITTLPEGLSVGGYLDLQGKPELIVPASLAAKLGNRVIR